MGRSQPFITFIYNNCGLQDFVTQSGANAFSSSLFIIHIVAIHTHIELRYQKRAWVCFVEHKCIVSHKNKIQFSLRDFSSR
jgi:hypothetical protein